MKKTPTDSWLFAANRLMDVVFINDMVMSFFLPFKRSEHLGGGWETDRGVIRSAYLRSWFALDLLSVLPFELISLLDSGFGKMKAFRIVRILRVLKMLRIVRASRLLRRWESHLNINYSTLNILKFVGIIGVVSHWMSCIWGAMASIEQFDSYTWVSAWLDKQVASGVLVNSADEGSTHVNGYFTEGVYDISELYLAALHWAVVTLTSIGYGDIVPVNNAEYTVCIVLVIFGGCAWAFVIGSICASAADVDPHTTKFQQQMDRANFFMIDRALAPQLRLKIRSYLLQCRQGMREENTKSILGCMSPFLAAEVAWASSPFLRGGGICFLQGVLVCKDSNEFIVRLLQAMITVTYPPKERIVGANSMNVLKKGVAAMNGRLLRKWEVWGDDMVVQSMELREKKVALSLSYIQIMQLSRSDLYLILESFPSISKCVKRVAVWRATMKMVVLLARQSNVRAPVMLVICLFHLPRSAHCCCVANAHPSMQENRKTGLCEQGRIMSSSLVDQVGSRTRSTVAISTESPPTCRTRSLYEGISAGNGKTAVPKSDQQTLEKSDFPSTSTTADQGSTAGKGVSSWSSTTKLNRVDAIPSSIPIPIPPFGRQETKQVETKGRTQK